MNELAQPSASQRFITTLIDKVTLPLAKRGLTPSNKQLGLSFGVNPQKFRQWIVGNNGINLNRAIRMIQTWNKQEGFPKMSVIQLVLLEERVIWDFTLESEDG